ncbi:hypothetical protein [Prochlorococcus sp. MIT 1306]|uniref:hypothetical protein n=1 Tax=Prochlorococcus sp. MIT 1306 TaxID=1799667 RepID=UPI0012E8AFBC|nr:hypothetical protein [Prochlorococcus sp. MIT 1306]
MGASAFLISRQLPGMRSAAGLNACTRSPSSCRFWMRNYGSGLPRCVEQIRALRFTVFKSGLEIICKTSDPAKTHASVGLGYCALGR